MPKRESRPQGAAIRTGEVPQSVPRTADIARRRRISRALDDLCGIERTGIDPAEVDYWHDAHMDLGWAERDRAGRALAGAAA